MDAQCCRCSFNGNIRDRDWGEVWRESSELSNGEGPDLSNESSVHPSCLHSQCRLEGLRRSATTSCQDIQPGTRIYPSRDCRITGSPASSTTFTTALIAGPVYLNLIKLAQFTTRAYFHHLPHQRRHPPPSTSSRGRTETRPSLALISYGEHPAKRRHSSRFHPPCPSCSWPRCSLRRPLYCGASCLPIYYYIVVIPIGAEISGVLVFHNTLLLMGLCSARLGQTNFGVERRVDVYAAI